MTKIAQILENVEAALRQITVANGYKTDIGNHVFYWQDIGFEYGELGAVAYQDTTSWIEQKNSSYEHHQRLELLAIAYVNHEADPAAFNALIRAKADDLRSDLFQCVRSNQSWNRLVFNTQPVPDQSTSHLVETGGQTAIRYGIEIEISYRTDPWEV